MKKNIIAYSIMAAELAAIIFLAVQNGKLRDDTYSKTDYLSAAPEYTENKTGQSEDTESQIEQNEKEKIIIHENGNNIVEYPYIDAPLHDYDFSRLTTDERKKKMYYDENGEKAAVFGIDVSQYQGNVDWNRVKADGVDFAVLRLGYRGYETGKICDDSKFLDYVEGTKAAGIDIGVYFYSQAVNAAEAVEEADYILNTIAENNIHVSYPIVFDWEFVQDEDPARTDDLSSELINECCIAFCEKIRSAGYETMFYANITDSLFKYDLTKVSKYGLWLAEYSKETDYIYDFDMWQYSCSGLIDGIDSLVDLNLWFKDHK